MGPYGVVQLPTITQFYFLRKHRLHGTITGMESIKTLSSSKDKLDHLLVSFKDAKVSSLMLIHISFLNLP